MRKNNVLAMILLLAVSLSISVSPAGEKPKAKFIRNPDVVYVGTPYDIVSKMLQLAKIKKTDVVYDLGCGDGRMVVLAAQKYGCRAAGYDIDPDRINESLDNVEKGKVENLVKILQEDIFTVDLTDVDVLPIYLLPEMNRRLLPQIEKMKPGSRIVCHNYDLEGIKPDQTIKMTSSEDNSEHTLYLYTTPLKRQ